MFSSYLFSTMLLVQTLRTDQFTQDLDYLSFQTQSNQNCISDSIPHPSWKNQHIYLFRPQFSTGKSPVIFFCHGITATNPSTYKTLINHMVSRGYAVIYSPYPSLRSYIFPRLSYKIMYKGFVNGAEEWNRYLDLENIALVGHSFGAGAIPSIARKLIIEKKWGTRSAFLYMMAPWYVKDIRQRHLRNFPKHVKMVVEVFAEDIINDHRIGKDIFLSMGIPDSAKMFCVLESGKSHAADTQFPDHDVPTGSSDQSLTVNDFDYCGIHFLFDALHSYPLNPEVKSLLFNTNDTTLQVKGPSGGNCRISIINKPAMKRTQEVCMNFWGHSMNPRRKLYKYIGEPLRLVLATPETAFNYGTMALTSLSNRMIND